MDDPWLVRLLDEGRAAAADRLADEQRLHERIATESATLAGTLVGLAEAARPVVLRTRGGRRHQGVIDLVATDFLTLTGLHGRVWCRLDAIAAIRVGADTGPARGEREPADLRLADVLAGLVDDRPRVALEVGPGEPVVGELVAVGADVLTVELDGGERCYVASTSVDAVLRSG